MANGEVGSTSTGELNHPVERPLTPRTAETNNLCQQCWNLALYAFGTASAFQKRSQKYKRRLRWLSFAGIVFPLMIGGLVLSFGNGSIYLHCDPTASHYLKLLLDSIFGPVNFRNEIVWKRSHAHSDSKQGATHYGRVTDTILFFDPFCGCGTAIVVAQKLSRRWIGIDITHLAIGLIKSRLRDAFGDSISTTYTVVGEPVSVPDAVELAQQDPFQFQWWALGLVGARRAEERKGPDRGIDGRLYFHDEENGRTKEIILSVKSGHVTARDVRDLRGVIDREKAQIGVLLTLQEPTAAMKSEAASAEFYKSPWGNHPRLQIITIAELLNGKRIDYPPTLNVTHKRAPRAEPPLPEQFTLASTAPAEVAKVENQIRATKVGRKR